MVVVAAVSLQPLWPIQLLPAPQAVRSAQAIKANICVNAIFISILCNSGSSILKGTLLIINSWEGMLMFKLIEKYP